MSRITLLLVLGSCIPFFTTAQVFESIPLGKQTLPPIHGKSHWQGAADAPAAAVVAAPNSTGTAGHHAHHPFCVFDEMNEQQALTDPDFAKELERYLQEVVPVLSETSGAAKSTVPPLLTISVVVHVIHQGEPLGTGPNIPDEQIWAQLQIFNEDFSSINPQFFNTPSQWAGIAGVPNIEFCLASVDPNGNPTNGITRNNLQITGSSWNNNNINSFIKPQTNWDPLRYFNIYVLPIPGTTSAGGVVGFSNYPTPGLIGAQTDGVVIDYRWFGAPGYPVSGWRALTHEAGHYLGLPHTFNGNSCSNDDGIQDTPNIDKSTREYVTLNCSNNYPVGPMSCGNEHLYVNYMDYVNENCYTSFTQGQVNVMRAVLDGTSQGFGYGSRNGLIQNAPSQCVIPMNDAGITRIVAPSPVNCTPSTLVPTVTLRNFGSADLTSANITYRVGNGFPVTQPWQGSLYPGQSTNVTLSAFSPPNGQYVLRAFAHVPNGSQDERPANDTTAGAFFTYLATPPPMHEDFEGETGFPVSTGIFPFNFNNDDFEWELTNEASGFGTGNTSAMFDNYAGTLSNNPFGTIDALITRHFDLTNVTGAQLKFDVAYAQFDNILSDTLLVLVATNCSQNFNQLVYVKGGAQLATAPPATEPFVPLASQWRTETIDLSAYDGMNDVTLALVNLSGWGNRLYLDNIRVGTSCSAITWDFDIVPNSCNNAPGSCNGTATVHLNNHNGGLSYQWQGWPVIHNQPTIYLLCPQQVTVTVTDAFGCQVVASANVPQAPPPTLGTSSTQVTTYNGSDGTATVTVSGGAAPYSYAWSNGMNQSGSAQNSSTITGLAAGSYTVTVTDGNNCESTATVTVGSICTSFLVNTTTGNVSCHGSSNGSVLAAPQNGNPPYNYIWSNGATTAMITNVPAGAYTVTVTSGNGCPATKTATVLEPPAIVLNLASTGETALNSNDGTASVTPSGGSPGYTYLWSNGATLPSLTGLVPGNYSVTVTDVTGCTASGSVIVNPLSCAGFSAFINTTNITCHGAANGTASVTTSGSIAPVLYNWSNGQTTQTVSNLPPGPVSVSVSDAVGCSAVLNVEITQPAPITLNVSATGETAFQANDGTATATAGGGTGSLQYLWSNGQTTPAILNLPPGPYTVSVTDGNGCQISQTIVVEAVLCGLAIELSFAPSSCPNAADGMAAVATVLNGTGPFQYIWSNGNSNFMLSNIPPGLYEVTVTDGNSCTATGSVNVPSADVTPPMVLTQNITLPLGANGSASITADLVDNGTFDNCSLANLIVSPSTFNCSHIGQQTVTLQATDSSGNTATGQATVIIVDQTPPVVHCPADLTVTDCGPVSYNLPTATDACSNVTLVLTGGLNSGQVFPNGATLVTWTGTDAYGNAATCQFTVTVENDLAVQAEVTQPTCHGASDGAVDLIISGGTPPYTVNWGIFGGPTNLAAGNYSVLVADATGCSTTLDYHVGQPEPLQFVLISIKPATAGANDGEIDFEITGGSLPYQVHWADGNGVPLPGFNPVAVPAGTYSATVTDANGCTIQTTQITVDQITASFDVVYENAVRVFPNPSAGQVTLALHLPKAEKTKIAVFDMAGRLLLDLPEEVVSTKTIPLDLRAQAAGVYRLMVVIGDVVVWRKVIVF